MTIRKKRMRLKPLESIVKEGHSKGNCLWHFPYPKNININPSMVKYFGKIGWFVEFMPDSDRVKIEEDCWFFLKEWLEPLTELERILYE